MFKSSAVYQYTDEKEMREYRTYLREVLVTEVEGETILFIPPATEEMLIEDKEGERSLYRVYPLPWSEVDEFIFQKNVDSQKFLEARLACIRYAIKVYQDKKGGATGFTGHVITALNKIYEKSVKLGFAAEAAEEIKKLIDELPNTAHIWEYLRLAHDIKAVVDCEPRATEFPQEHWVADDGDAMLVFKIFHLRPGWKMIRGGVVNGRVISDPHRRLEVSDFGKFYDINNHGTAWGYGLREDRGYGHFGKHPPHDIGNIFKFNYSCNSNGDGYSWVIPNPFPDERLIAVAEGYCGTHWVLSLPKEGFYPVDEDGYNIFVDNGWARGLRPLAKSVITLREGKLTCPFCGEGKVQQEKYSTCSCGASICVVWGPPPLKIIQFNQWIPIEEEVVTITPALFTIERGERKIIKYLSSAQEEVKNFDRIGMKILEAEGLSQICFEE